MGSCTEVPAAHAALLEAAADRHAGAAIARADFVDPLWVPAQQYPQHMQRYQNRPLIVTPAPLSLAVGAIRISAGAVR